MANKVPFEIKRVTEEEDKVIKKYYKGYTRPFLRVGPSRYLLTPGYGEHAEKIFNIEVRPDDIWVVTFSRSVLHMPIFPHIEEAWRKRNDPNVLFLFYEEMQKNLKDVIDRVSKFFNKEYSEEQKESLAQHLNFDNMKKTRQYAPKPGDDELQFMRKGKSGNWVNYFDEEMTREAEEYMKKHLEKTDLRFPSVPID